MQGFLFGKATAPDKFADLTDGVAHRAALDRPHELLPN